MSGCVASLKQWYDGDIKKCPNGWRHIGACVTYTMNGFMGCTKCKSTGTQEWQFSWLGCCEDPCVCFFGCCCPLMCELQSQTLSAMQGIDNSEACCVSCGICLYAPCCTPCYHAGIRTAFREKYDLKGTQCCDLCGACFWSCCLICQEARELGYRKLLRPVPGSFMGREQDNKVGGMSNKATELVERAGNKTTAVTVDATRSAADKIIKK